jgi:Spy/CpxP family protein refolding chaperone
MRRQSVAIGMVVLILAITAGVLIHALKTRRPKPADQEPGPVAGQRPSPASPDRFPPASGPQARPAPRDPLGESLFPPELIMQSQAQIGLSEDQRQAIMSEMQKVQPKLEGLHRRLQEERAALGPLLSQGRVDLESALAQADKVQALEQEIKRTQLTLLIALKNHLTPEQHARLQEIKPPQGPGPGQPSGPNPPPVIIEKMQQLQAGMQRWHKDGRDGSAVVQIMQRFEPLIRGGQFEEAEAVLDEALALLEKKRER